MKVKYENKKELRTILADTFPLDDEELDALMEAPEFWEIDTEIITEKYGETNPETILEYYWDDREPLVIIKEEMDEEYEYNNWNVNVWRNS